MTLNDTKRYLQEVKSNFNSRDSDPILEFLDQKKQDMVSVDDQDCAKEIWCLEQIIRIQDGFINAFYQLKNGDYYKGWCSFEQVELKLQFLSRHFDTNSNIYQLNFIDKHTEKFQSIFPYKIFMSPEFVEKEKVCNICDKKISIRNPCGHRVGEIYDGEMCSRIVKKADLLSISFVENPVQKYSVPFTKDEETDEQIDHYNYQVVEYLIERLKAPFDGWDIDWQERRIPHEKFPDVGRNEKCPCDSGKKYKKCCLNKEGVLRPHCEFIFDNPPPDNMNTLEYTF